MQVDRAITDEIFYHLNDTNRNCISQAKALRLNSGSPVVTIDIKIRASKCFAFFLFTEYAETDKLFLTLILGIVAT